MENTTSSSNKTEEQWKIAIKTFGLVLTTCLIFFGNSLCLVVLRNTKMNEISRQFMYSLSLSDLMVGIIITLPATIASPFGDWPLGNTMCFLNSFMGGAISFITAWALVALSVERYFAICYPLRYPVIVTLPRARVTVVLIWIGAFALETLVAYYSNFNVFYDTFTYSCWFMSTTSSWILYISLLMYLIFPWCTIVSLYARMFHIARKHLNRKHAEELQINRSEGRQTKKESKAATTFVIITVAYGLAALSTILFTMYENLTGNDTPKSISFVVFLVLYGNSWVNVVVYYWRTKSFQQTAKEIIAKTLRIEKIPQALDGSTSR